MRLPAGCASNVSIAVGLKASGTRPLSISTWLCGLDGVGAIAEFVEQPDSSAMTNVALSAWIAVGNLIDVPPDTKTAPRSKMDRGAAIDVGYPLSVAQFAPLV